MLVALCLTAGEVQGQPAGEPLELFAPALDDELRLQVLQSARAALTSGRPVELGEQSGAGARWVIVSLARQQRSALVAQGEGPTLVAAVASATDRLRSAASVDEILAGRVKIDVAIEASGSQAFDPQGRVSTIERTLEGLWLTAAGLLLLPEELVSRRLVNSDGSLQWPRLRFYLAEGVRPGVRVASNPGLDGRHYQIVRFDSFAESEEGHLVRLFRGNELSIEPTEDRLQRAVGAAADFLLRHRRPDGSYHYRYQPKWNDYGDGDNLLRQAGTSYATLELYRALGDERLLEAARATLGWLLARTRPPPAEVDRADWRALVSPGEEAKLGGAALLVLALVEHQRVSGDRRFFGQAQELARFMHFMQDEDGHFRSKFFYGPPDEEVFESVYYPGEAVLALVRLYGIDPNPMWLETARRGADWLIGVRDAGKPVSALPHDHWLLMGLSELSQLTDQAGHEQHAEKIGRAIVRAVRRSSSDNPDWIGSFYTPPRSTPTATRSEALVAMHALATRSGRDPQPYRDALLLMTGFQLRTQLTPVNSIYLPRPERGLGGFRRSLNNWEVRIDYVQHNASAMLGVLRLLGGG